MRKYPGLFKPRIFPRRLKFVHGYHVQGVFKMHKRDNHLERIIESKLGDVEFSRPVRSIYTGLFVRHAAERFI